MSCCGGGNSGASHSIGAPLSRNNVNASRNPVTLPAILAAEQKAQRLAFNAANPVLAQQNNNLNNVAVNAVIGARAGCCGASCCGVPNAAQRRQLEVIAGRRAALIGDRLQTMQLNSLQSVAVDAQIALERDAILAARAGTGNILVQGRRGACGIRRPREGGCLPLVDADILALQEQLATPFCRSRCQRVCREPSMFRALTAQGAVEQSFNAGMIDELPTLDSFAGRGSRGTAALPGAGVGLRFGNLSVRAQNILQQPRTFCRSPSVFGCLSQQCASAACLQLGVTNQLPEIGISSIDARANASLGGPLISTNGNNICLPAVRFGNEI